MSFTSLGNNYNTSGCKYAVIFGDMNEWHLISLTPYIKSTRTKQATRAHMAKEADLLLQEETDSFMGTIVKSLADGRPTHAMQVV